MGSLAGLLGFDAADRLGGGPPDDAGAFIARSAFRLDEDPPTYSDHHIGFRIVSPD